MLENLLRLRMSRRRISRLLVVGLGVVLTGCATDAAGEMGYAIVVQQPADQVDVGIDNSNSNGEQVITIHSPGGIGSALIVGWGQQRYTSLHFHLYLTGLEHFELRWLSTTGMMVVAAAVSSLDASIVQHFVAPDGSEHAVALDSAYWLAVAPPNPLQQPYFAITAPAALLTDPPNLLRIGWVDFYR